MIAVFLIRGNSILQVETRVSDQVLVKRLKSV